MTEQKLEEIIYNEFQKDIQSNNVRRLENDEATIMVSLLLGAGELPPGLKEAIKKDFLTQVIIKRVDVCFKYKMDIKMIIFLASICNNPAEAVMYIWFFHFWCKKNNIELLTLNEVCENVFPWGVMKEERLNEIWKMQKINNIPDNLVDIVRVGE